MTANRRRLGRTSRKSSNRLPVRSVAWSDRPGTLPPDRVARRRKDDRDNRRCFLCREGCASRRDNDIDLETDELGRDLEVALAAPLGPAILNRDGATPDPAEFAQALHKSSGPLVLARGRRRAQEPNGRQLRGCCPRAASGHVAAPLISVMNSRRLK